MQCHCQYLEPSFWHSDECEVMCNTFSPQSSERLERWLTKHPELRSYVFFQTSGSTGKSKWVALSKAALLASARAVNEHLGVQTGARWGVALPIFHVGGFGMLVRAFLSGGKCQVFHGAWDPASFTRFVYTEKCEYLSLVPTQVVDLVERRCVAPLSVKCVVVGGGALSDAIFDAAKQLGWPLLRSYGMTESASQIATGDNGEGWLDLLAGRELRVSEQGVLEWRSEAGLSFYLIEDEGEFRRVDPLRNGWFTTEDRVELRDGQLRVLGRADSLVKVLGELVNLNELEQAVRDHTGCDCIIFTEPDERRGVNLFAVVESSEEVDLTKFTGLHRLEAVFTDRTFLRSPLGKVKRAELVKKYANSNVNYDV